jgi:heme-degrading monooxygenase HmoA
MPVTATTTVTKIKGTQGFESKFADISNKLNAWVATQPGFISETLTPKVAGATPDIETFQRISVWTTVEDYSNFAAARANNLDWRARIAYNLEHDIHSMTNVVIS